MYLELEGGGFRLTRTAHITRIVMQQHTKENTPVCLGTKDAPYRRGGKHKTISKHCNETFEPNVPKRSDVNSCEKRNIFGPSKAEWDGPIVLSEYVTSSTTSPCDKHLRDVQGS